MFNSNVFIGSLIAVLIIVFSACIDEPTSVGIDILPKEKTDEIFTVVIEANDSYSFDTSVDFTGSVFGPPTIFVGENDEFKSSAIIRLDSLLVQAGLHPDTLDRSRFLEAKLFLTPVTFYGDTTDTVHINLYTVEQGWTPGSMNRDMFNTIQFGSTIVGSSSIQLGDTTDVEFVIPTELIKRWARDGSQLIIPQGLLLSPSSTSNGIIGFSAISNENPARLRIIHGSGDERDTTFFQNFSRAFISEPKVDYIEDPNSILIQAGVLSRSIVQFDLNEIPRGALIHRADFEIVLDDEKTRMESTIKDSLTVSPVIDINKIDFAELVAPFTTVEESNGNIIYRATISTIVQNWVTRFENLGLLIKDQNEISGFHRTAFHSATTDDTNKRPRLTILYSTF